MERILFQYPYFVFNEDDPENSDIIPREACIHPLNLSHEPYEAILIDGEKNFHMIFGGQANGNFLCIPNCFIGCELSSYANVHWNDLSLTEAADYNGRLNYNDVSAICYALKTLQPHLK